MKKTLLFILCLAGMTSLSNATVTTIDCSTVTWNTSVKNEISGSAEGFDISAVKNNGQTPPTYNTSAKDVRIYAKGSITITSTSGKPITILLSGSVLQGKNVLLLARQNQVLLPLKVTPILHANGADLPHL